MNEIDKILRMKLIGACCRERRIKVLGLSLQQFQDKAGIKLKKFLTLKTVVRVTLITCFTISI